MDRESKHGVPATVDVALLGHFYERFADHAVEVGRRVVFGRPAHYPLNRSGDLLDNRCPATATRSRDHATTLLRARDMTELNLRGRTRSARRGGDHRTATVVAGVKEEEEG